MYGKLLEALLKGAANYGVKQYQKYGLEKKAAQHGKTFASLQCSISESGVLGWQDGQLVICEDCMIFTQLGKSTQIGLKLQLSWTVSFPLYSLEYIMTDESTLFGTILQKSITFNHNDKLYKLRIKRSDGDIFIKAIEDARTGT